MRLGCDRIKTFNRISKFRKPSFRCVQSDGQTEIFSGLSNCAHADVPVNRRLAGAGGDFEAGDTIVGPFRWCIALFFGFDCHTVPAVSTLEKMARALEVRMYRLNEHPNLSPASWACC